MNEEVAAFEDIFGSHTPGVVVPPTFVWNEMVERDWAAAGIGVIVTPGRRYETRDESGQPAGEGSPVHNGQVGEKMALFTWCAMFILSRRWDTGLSRRTMHLALKYGTGPAGIV